MSGQVCVVHRETHTYLEDLSENEYFGELCFFSYRLETDEFDTILTSNQVRGASVKSRDFTILLSVDVNSYFELRDQYPESEVSLPTYSDWCALGSL